MADINGDGDGWQRWQLQWPTVTETAMANGKGNSNGNGWWQRNREGGGNGWPQLQQQWLMATATAMVDGQWQRQRQWGWSWQQQWRWRRWLQWRWPWQGQQWQREGCLFMCSDVQRCGRGDTLLPPPWTQRKVHSPALCHGGDTAKSVCSLSRGRVPDSSPWIVFLFIFYNYCSVYWTSLCLPPALFRHSRALSALWCSTSSTPPRTLPAYWQSTPAPIALFIKVSPGRACNDYNLTFLCWCEMTNLSATFFISQTLLCHWQTTPLSFENTLLW